MGESKKTSTGPETVTALARALSSASAPSPAAIAQAQLLLLDTLGCGIAGSQEAVAQAIAEVALRSSGQGTCSLICLQQRTDALSAALINGVAIRVLDLNDYTVGQSKGSPETAGHPSDNIPVALAMGAQRGHSGAQILQTIIVGYELYARLQHLMDRGGAWDGVSVSGIVAAAMAGKLMGLDEGRLAHAIALGASRAATPSIVRRGDISAAKSIANALTAQAGVQAAFFAERGLTGPLGILDDPRGLSNLFANAELSILTEPFSPDGAIMRAHVKAYPCVNTGQGAVAAALKLHALLSGNLENLSRIDLVMADYPVIERQQGDPGRTWPKSREAADHSFPFLVAVTLRDGQFGPAQFESVRWNDPHVVALMDKIVMTRDTDLNQRAPGAFPCVLRATYSDGRSTTAEVLFPPGFSKGGLDRSAVIEKFHNVTSPILDNEGRRHIVDVVMDFHHSQTTSALDSAISIKGTFT